MSFEPFTQKPHCFSQVASAMQFIKTGTAVVILVGLFLAACVSYSSRAETVNVSTFANEIVSRADGIAVDAAGNLYVANTLNHRIRKVTQEGEVTMIAGGGEKGFADGEGNAARFNHPSGIAIDAAGNLYVADKENNRIRKIVIRRFALSEKTLDEKIEVSTLAGDGKEGFADGQGSAARFYHPEGIAIDRAGNLYVADTHNHRIRKITPKGEVSTLAGAERGFADGRGSAARFYYPSDIVIDRAGNLYVTDTHNNRIRKITPEGDVSTLAGGKGGFSDGAGSAARFYWPSGITIDTADNLYVADKNNDRIRKVTPEGEVSTLAGHEAGFTDGEGSAAQFDMIRAIAIDAAGNLYVTGSRHGIRKITFVSGKIETESRSVAQDDVQTIIVSTLAGSEPGFSDGKGSDARFNGPFGITIDAAGNLYVTDVGGSHIRKVTPKGEVSTLAGSGKSGFADGEGSTAQFDVPSDITIDAAGNLYVADSGNHRIRKVTLKGEVSTLAGSGATGTFSGGGFADGAGSVARFYGPSGIAIDAAGNLYVADKNNHRIRKVTPNGDVSTFVGGKRGFADGEGNIAQFYFPSSIAIDAAGNLYVVDSGNHRIRKIVTLRSLTNEMTIVSTLAGSEAGFADGQGSAARFDSPSGIAIDTMGNLYVVDSHNHRIRRITPKGEVSTLAGSAPGSADGEGRSARFSWPRGIVIDTAGNLYVADSVNNRIRKIAIQ